MTQAKSCGCCSCSRCADRPIDNIVLTITQGQRTYEKIFDFEGKTFNQYSNNSDEIKLFFGNSSRVIKKRKSNFGTCQCEDFSDFKRRFIVKIIFETEDIYKDFIIENIHDSEDDLYMKSMEYNPDSKILTEILIFNYLDIKKTISIATELGRFNGLNCPSKEEIETIIKEGILSIHPDLSETIVFIEDPIIETEESLEFSYDTEIDIREGNEPLGPATSECLAIGDIISNLNKDCNRISRDAYNYEYKIGACAQCNISKRENLHYIVEGGYVSLFSDCKDCIDATVHVSGRYDLKDETFENSFLLDTFPSFSGFPPNSDLPLFHVSGSPVIINNGSRFAQCCYYTGNIPPDPCLYKLRCFWASQNYICVQDTEAPTYLSSARIKTIPGIVRKNGTFFQKIDTITLSCCDGRKNDLKTLPRPRRGYVFKRPSTIGLSCRPIKEEVINGCVNVVELPNVGAFSPRGDCLHSLSGISRDGVVFKEFVGCENFRQYPQTFVDYAAFSSFHCRDEYLVALSETYFKQFDYGDIKFSVKINFKTESQKCKNPKIYLKHENSDKLLDLNGCNIKLGTNNNFMVDLIFKPEIQEPIIENINLNTFLDSVPILGFSSPLLNSCNKTYIYNLSGTFKIAQVKQSLLYDRYTKIGSYYWGCESGEVPSFYYTCRNSYIDKDCFDSEFNLFLDFYFKFYQEDNRTYLDSSILVRSASSDLFSNSFAIGKNNGKTISDVEDPEFPSLRTTPCVFSFNHYDTIYRWGNNIETEQQTIYALYKNLIEINNYREAYNPHRIDWQPIGILYPGFLDHVILEFY